MSGLWVGGVISLVRWELTSQVSCLVIGAGAIGLAMGILSGMLWLMYRTVQAMQSIGYHVD